MVTIHSPIQTSYQHQQDQKQRNQKQQQLAKAKADTRLSDKNIQIRNVHNVNHI